MRILEFAPFSAVRRSLYVSRPVLNGEQIREWAREQGFPSTVDPTTFHLTLAYSKEPVAWEAIPPERGEWTSEGGPRSVSPLGDKGAVVLRFEDAGLADRWKGLCAAGCRWKWPDYKPHITLTYAGQRLPFNAILPYTGPIILGPEQYAEVQDDWQETIQEIALGNIVTEGLIKVPAETLRAITDYVVLHILWQIRDRFTPAMRGEFPAHYDEVTRLAAEYGVKIPRTKYAMPENGIAVSEVPFPGIDGGLRVALDWKGKAVRPASRGDGGRAAAGWLASQRVIFLYLSDFRELNRFPDRQYHPDNLSYVLDTLRESVTHELRHAVQDLTLPSDQRKRHPDYGKSSVAYYTSPMEFDPQIGSAVHDFVAYIKAASPKPSKFGPLLRQYVGASKGNPLGGLSTNDFFRALKKNAPERWKDAVRKFYTEVMSAMRQPVKESVGSDREARSLAGKVMNACYDFIKGRKTLPLLHTNFGDEGRPRPFEYIPGERLDVGADISDLVVIFAPGEMRGRARGTYGRTHVADLGMRHFIAVHAEPRYLLRTDVMETFLHEFTHYLDAKRQKDPAADTARYDVPDEHLGRLAPEKRAAFLRRYYASPAEFNAFYHELAGPLHDLMNEAPQAIGSEARELRDLYLNDAQTFADYVSMRTRERASLKRMMTMLKPSYRTKLLRRLGRLWLEMEAMVRQKEQTT